jgi:flagellar biosynthesis/type III secretory pathway M-ring protein FliF/YscJ
MESLRKLLVRIVAQLRGLSLSQRLAILLGGLLVGVSVVSLVRWAAAPEMVPLLNQDLQPDELARARDGLDLMNESYRLVGRKVMVRADANRQVILAHLQQQDKLPTDTSTGFDALVKESNPWISQAEHERRWAVALKHELEEVLQQFEGVRSASVFLPLGTSGRMFAKNAPATTASVTLTMQGGRPVPRELALAAARLVAGAVRGLSLKNVEVLDGNGVAALDWEGEAAGSGVLERQRRKEEQDIQKKIVNQLPDPRVRVSIQVDLELTNLNVESEVPSKPVEISSDKTERETTRIRNGGQPGVQPNVGVTAGGRAADESTVENTEKSEYVPAVTRERKATPPGAIKEVWAAVNVSRSYLESILRRTTPDATTASDQQIQQVFEREKVRIVSQVTKLVKPQDEAHVAVDWYYDSELEGAPPARSSALDETFQWARRYGPQSGLAMLALVSLGLMLRMARKSDASEAFGLEIGLPQEAIEAAQQAARDADQVAQRRTRGVRQAGPAGTESQVPEGLLEVGPISVGQASVTEGVLVAQEVDEKTVQTHKMLEQVAQVVDGDEEGTSALLEQWIQRSDTFGG